VALGIQRQVAALLIPVAQHDARGRPAVDFQAVQGRPVRVAMDQQVRGTHAQQASDGLRTDVHDAFRRALRVRATARTGRARQGAPGCQWQRQKATLRGSMAREFAEALVSHVRRAQHIAVRQQQCAGAQLHTHRVGQQMAAAAALEARAQQEIAIAALDVAGRQPRVCKQRIADGGARRLVIVIADPGFEQIPQDVKRLRALRRALQKFDELRHGARGLPIQMQVGNKQIAAARHASNIVQGCRKVL